MFGWAARFSDDWGTLPAEPVLYFFMMTGAIQIILTKAPAPQPVSHSPYWVAILWRVTTVAAPLLAVLGWWLVSKRSGSARLFGLWMRFAGDFSQAVGLMFFLLIRWSNTPVNDDAHVYLMHLAMGVFAFVAMLVVRDVWILRQVSSIAAYLDRLAEGIDPERL
jgi:hypothetical protein